MFNANHMRIAAGWVMLLSTAYRVWAAWRFDMRMPFPVFGSSDQWEAANFLRVKVHRGCRRNVCIPHDPVAKTQDASHVTVIDVYRTFQTQTGFQNNASSADTVHHPACS